MLRHRARNRFFVLCQIRHIRSLIRSLLFLAASSGPPGVAWWVVREDSSRVAQSRPNLTPPSASGGGGERMEEIGKGKQAMYVSKCGNLSDSVCSFRHLLPSFPPTLPLSFPFITCGLVKAFPIIIDIRHALDANMALIFGSRTEGPPCPLSSFPLSSPAPSPSAPAKPNEESPRREASSWMSSKPNWTPLL